MELDYELIDLRGIRISDPFDVNPVRGLLVLRVVNLLRRVYRRVEILEQATRRLGLAIELNLVGVVRAA